MSSSAINAQLFQAKIGSIQNQADSTSVYSNGQWSFKNSTALPSVTITDAGNVGIGTASPVFKIDTSLGNLSATTAGLRLVTGNIGNLVVGLSQVSTNMGAASTSGDIYTTAALDLRFGTNNAERMRIDASGNVGINAVSPTSRLTIGTGTFTAAAAQTTGMYTNGTNGLVVLTDAMSVNSRTGTNFLNIDASGNVGIGQASLGAKLHVQGLGAVVDDSSFEDTTSYGSFGVTRSSVGANTKSYYALTKQGSFVWGLGIAPDNSFVIGNPNVSRELPTSTERLRIDASGNLLVGSTVLPNGTQNASALRGTADANLFLSRNSTSAATQAAFFNPNGVVGTIQTSGTSTSYITSSDYRLKEAVQPMAAALSKVAALKPCTYKWKVDGSEGEGFIAHELAEVCPSAVAGEKDAINEDGSIKPQGIDPSKLVALLTAAIQELSAKNDALEARLAASDARLAALEAK